MQNIRCGQWMLAYSSAGLDLYEATCAITTAMKTTMRTLEALPVQHQAQRVNAA